MSLHHIIERIARVQKWTKTIILKSTIYKNKYDSDCSELSYNYAKHVAESDHHHAWVAVIQSVQQAHEGLSKMT